MGSKNALSFAAGFGTGYMNEAQRQKEQERQARLDQIQTDRAAREQTTFDQQQADSRTLRDAAKPVGVEQPNDVLMDDDGNPMPAVPAFRVAGQRYDSLDQAQTAATAANTPDAMAARQAAALNQVGRPDQAMSLQSAQTTQKLHTLQLGEAEQAAIKQKFLRDAGSAISQGGHTGAADFLTKSKADGNDYKAEKDENGNIAYYQVNRETGQARPIATFEDSEKGRMDAFSMLAASVSPEHMVAHYKDERDFGLKQQAANDKQTYQAGLLDSKREQLKTQGELNLARAEAARAKAEQAGKTAPAPVWDAKADEFLKSKYAYKDEMTGRPVVDGDGMRFAKMVALAEARRNGGDTTVALGRAMDIDAKIAADAGGDKDKIRALRNTTLNAIFNPPAAQPAPVAPQTPYGKAAAAAQAAGAGGSITLTPGVGNGFTAGAPSPTLADAAPKAPTIQDKISAETREMNDLKRTEYSPDVKAYLDQQKAAKDAQAKADSDAYKKRMFEQENARRNK